MTQRISGNIQLAVPSRYAYDRAAHYGWVAELCLALRHRWMPEELFLIYTAYFDESGTHGPAPTVILAGMLGTVRQWELFERRLRGLQRAEQFAVFHAKDLRAARREFDGWEQPKKDRVVSRLTEIVRDTLTEGVTVALDHNRYINEYRSPPLPKKMNLDSQYGVCFRFCVSHIIHMLLAAKGHHRLNVVIEDNQRFGDCKRIFNQIKAHLKAQGIELLGNIVPAAKTECPPLMSADLIAHTILLLDRRIGGGAPAYARLTNEQPRGRQAGFSMLEILPNALTEIKRQFEEARLMRVEKWRKERDARKSVSPAPSREEQPA